MAREPLPYVEQILDGKSSPGPTRRAILGAMGISGASLLAGCFGDSDDGEGGNYIGDIDLSKLDNVDGQVLRFATATDPEEITFLQTTAFPYPVLIGNVDWVVPDIYNMMMEPGMYGMWANKGLQTGDAINLQFENVDITPDEITVDIRDDAVWSDGRPVRGQDFITHLAVFRMFDNITPVQQTLEDGAPVDIPVSTITDFEFDDSSFTLISEGGWFDELLQQDIWAALVTGWVEWGGINFPTHVEPYAEYTDIVWNHWEMYLSGEWTHPMLDGDKSIREPLMERLNMESNHWPEQLRIPKNVVTNGAWSLGEIRGAQEVVLEKNEHHRNADLINFDEVIIEYRDENRANWAALQSERLDHFSGSMPNDVMESLPEIYETRSKAIDNGFGLALDHSSEMFEDVRARQAFMYLFDTEQLAQVEGEKSVDPITTPGGDVRALDAIIGEDFADENLRTYGHDSDAAEDLLEQAGWSKSGGTWSTPSGSTAELTFPTTAETPRWEQNLVDQLNDFGIEANLQIYDESVYADRMNNFEFDMWSEGQDLCPGLGYPNWGLARSWSHLPAQWVWTQQTNIFPQEQVEQTEYGPFHGGYDHEYGLIADTSTEPEGFGGYTIEMPEVGDWDGDIREWELPALAWEAFRADGREVIEENYPIMAWAVNYFLPGIPLMNDLSTHVVNTDNWYWPAEDSDESAPIGIDTVGVGTLVTQGDKILANPDNPRTE